MLRSLLSSVVVIALLIAICPSVSAVNPDVDAIFERFDAPGSPGCACGVMQDGEVVFAAGYGMANLDHDVPITPESVFDVGSVTKQFVAATIATLVLEGKLSLDDDIRDYLPELPEYENMITVGNLVHHTSGLPDYLMLMPLAGVPYRNNITHQDIVDLVGRQEALYFQPGEQFMYSNTGYMFLAYIVKRVTGVTINEYATEHLFGPAGMAATRFYEDKTWIIKNRATGYNRAKGGGHKMVQHLNFDIPGDGQLTTTVLDLLKWEEAFTNDRVGPRGLRELAYTRGVLNNGEPIAYAFGLFFGDSRGFQTISHGGWTWGFRAQYMRFPEQGLAVAVLCNAEYANPALLAGKVADLYLKDVKRPPEKKKEPRKPAAKPAKTADKSAPPKPLDSAQLSAYAGSYYCAALDATYAVTVKDDGLSVRVEKDAPMQMKLTGEDLFTSSQFPAWTGLRAGTISFDRDSQDAVTGFRLHVGLDRNLRFRRE